MKNLPDNLIFEALTLKGFLTPEQCRMVRLKSSEKRKKLRQVHTVTVNGSQKTIEHVVSMTDIITDMSIPYPNSVSGYLEEDDLIQAVATHINCKYRRIDPLNLNFDLVTKTIPHLFALKNLVVPVDIVDGKLEVVMFNPQDTEIIEDIRRVANMDVITYMGTKSDILKILREFFGFKISISAAETQIAKPTFDIGNLEQYTNVGTFNELHGNDAHIKNAVDYLFHYAFDQRASDIHIEPRRSNTLIRMRIDGVLHTIYKLPKALHPAITSRIKTLSRLDIAEKRRPQDGRIKLSYEKKESEIRVSTIPVAFGEKLVLRILDPRVIFQNVKDLGLADYDLQTYEQFLTRTYGIILVTGPTGSGKSTTLYSSLGAISTPEINITTVEDPIEMVHEEFNQIAVQPAVGITFASILRHILRQDPDVIMIGEMRDQETAENGIQAALTGHLVFSTLHTNDAPSSIIRLVNLGVKPYLIGESLIGVVAQRLVRKICPYCIKTIKGDIEIFNAMGIDINEAKKLCGPDLLIKEGEGCPKCRGTGFLGRIGVFEVMPIDLKMKEMIIENQDINISGIRRRAIEIGMKTLRQDAIRKMLLGITTQQEIIRVTDAPYA